jgi:hypothetical protein
MNLRDKVKLYEEALNRIAVWHDGGTGMALSNLGVLDEPAAARFARQVLLKTGGAKLPESGNKKPSKQARGS